MLGKKRLVVVVTVCVNLFIFTVNSMVTPEVCLMMFVSKTIDILFFFPLFSFCQKKDIWSQLVENDCMFASMRFLIFLFCFLTFLFFSPARRFFLLFFSLFLHRWIIMMHIHRKTLLFFCRHKSVIDCSSSMCMCVYCLGSNCELFSVCPYSKRARASEHIFFVVN